MLQLKATVITEIIQQAGVKNSNGRRYTRSAPKSGKWSIKVTLALVTLCKSVV